MLSPVLVTPPVEMPVPLEEAKLAVQVTFSDDDIIISDMIRAAVSHLDGMNGTLGRALSLQTWSQEYDGFPAGDLVLPFGPVSSVTSVQYGADTFTDFRLLKDGRGAFLRPVTGVSWPSTSDPVTVTFLAGYSDVPVQIKAAILLHVRSLYYNEPLSPLYEVFLAPFRAWNA